MSAPGVPARATARTAAATITLVLLAVFPSPTSSTDGRDGQTSDLSNNADGTCSGTVENMMVPAVDCTDSYNAVWRQQGQDGAEHWCKATPGCSWTIPDVSDNRVEACPIYVVQERINAMNDACCTADLPCGDQSGPSICTTACAEVYRAFDADCGDMMAQLGFARDTLASFLVLCEATNACPLGYIEDATEMQAVCSGNGYCSTAPPDDLPVKRPANAIRCAIHDCFVCVSSALILILLYL